MDLYNYVLPLYNKNIPELTLGELTHGCHTNGSNGIKMHTYIIRFSTYYLRIQKTEYAISLFLNKTGNLSNLI